MNRMIDLDEILKRAQEAEARAEKASPEPWIADCAENGHYDVVIPGDKDPERWLATLRGSARRADATFIAAARTDVPALTADVRALVEKLQLLGGTCDELTKVAMQSQDLYEALHALVGVLSTAYSFKSAQAEALAKALAKAKEVLGG